jgi:hypothetical protein
MMEIQMVMAFIELGLWDEIDLAEWQAMWWDKGVAVGEAAAEARVWEHYEQ